MWIFVKIFRETNCFCKIFLGIYFATNLFYATVTYLCILGIPMQLQTNND